MTINITDQTAWSILATFAIAALFFILAGLQLWKEACRLRDRVNQVLFFLQNLQSRGDIQLRLDDKGEPAGLNITMRPESVPSELEIPPIGVTQTDPQKPPSEGGPREQTKR